MVFILSIISQLFDSFIVQADNTQPQNTQVRTFGGSGAAIGGNVNPNYNPWRDRNYGEP